MRILVIRMGAMGDVIHTLPAVAALRQAFPDCETTWVIDPKWAPLLDGNPHLNRVLLFDRKRLSVMRSAVGELRRQQFDLAVDFQGLIKSAGLARISGAPIRWGFENANLREPAAGVFYTHRATATAAHVVDKNLGLAAAATGHAANQAPQAPIPPGKPEGDLPAGPFVLACPHAGWASKQWPFEYYAKLAAMLPCPLVLNGPPPARDELLAAAGNKALVHLSSLPGLIDATRRAAAIVGVDSGPLHLAAALDKPGVAIFGPTDPARNGPYGGTIRVLRHPSAQTTYKRHADESEAMRAVTPEQVCQALNLTAAHAIS